jgi:hypothetical protein
VAAVLGGCLAFTSSPSPTPSPSPQPSPPADAAFLLRATYVQALPPRDAFTILPGVVITLDGRYLSGAPVPAIFPGPLVMPVSQRQLTIAGWGRVVAAAGAAGLLAGRADFTGGQLAPGSLGGRLELVVDGRLVTLTGDPSRSITCITAPCVAQPGSPEAFGGFWNQLTDLGSLLGSDIGAEQPYMPTGYAILVAAPPAEDANLPQRRATWPLAGGFAAFGKALADGSGGRCGIVSGADADMLRPLLQAANQLTPWQDPADGSAHGLTVRALLPGDGDPCAGLV